MNQIKSRKNNEKNRIIGIILGLITICAPTLVHAENAPASFQDLKVPKYKGVAILPGARKLRWGGDTILNYSIYGNNTGSYALDGYLKRENGTQAGDYCTGIGTGRTSHPNWSDAEPAPCYYFQFINHNSVSKNAYISGSWAPDDK